MRANVNETIEIVLSLKDVVEWLSVLLNLLFLLLIIKEKKQGWVFGIIGSFLSVYLFYSSQLYSEAILYFVYVVLGFYGLKTWTIAKKMTLQISELSVQKHMVIFACGFAATFTLGYFFKKYTDAALPYFDAFSTVFSIIATYLEARKILSTWLYWIVLNAFSVWLYRARDLNVYAALMLVYAVLSVLGWVQWRKSKAVQSAV